jgi:branched-chain amino acid transport system ATP-binding protein
VSTATTTGPDRHEGGTEDRLSIRGLCAGYGGTDVLHDVEIDIVPGEVVALLGANGAGKSTLLRVMSGQLRPRTGEWTIRGEAANRWRPDKVARSGVRWIGEPKPVYPNLTVGENLSIGGLTAQGDTAEQREWIHEILPILSERRRELAGRLSGGQQQLLAIGQALMSKPAFLLLDEPSLGLAPVMVETMASTITLMAERGIGVLWAEQFPRVALAHAQRVAVMQRGRIRVAAQASEVSAATLEEVYLGR